MIVAIDGPAGSGKSTTARRVAERLGWLYLDTGAMYRAVGLAFLEAGQPFTDAAADALMPTTTVDLVPAPSGAPEGLRVLLNGADVTGRIRTAEAADAASRASALAAVRTRMVEAQRRIARAQAGSGAVLEGRDIGTVVFPDADVKVFMQADLAARAARRHAELAARDADAPPGAAEAVAADLAERDRRDAERALAPLRPAADAVVIDTTALSVEEQVERVIALIRARPAA